MRRGDRECLSIEPMGRGAYASSNKRRAQQSVPPLPDRLHRSGRGQGEGALSVTIAATSGDANSMTSANELQEQPRLDASYELGASGTPQYAAIARSTLRVRPLTKSDGFTPKRRWNALVKWLWLAKPTCTATSPISPPDSSSRNRPLRRRSS